MIRNIPLCNRKTQYRCCRRECASCAPRLSVGRSPVGCCTVCPCSSISDQGSCPHCSATLPNINGVNRKKKKNCGKEFTGVKIDNSETEKEEVPILTEGTEKVPVGSF